MSNEKRKRSPNWLLSEKQLLIDLVEKHLNIVENKKTDGVTMKSKLAEWQLLSVEYNSQTTNCHRDAENLKRQWESMKKAAKKEASQARIRRIQSGGGPPDLKNIDPVYNRILSLINTRRVFGLINPDDNDNVAPVQNFALIKTEKSDSESLPGPSNTDLNEKIEINNPANNIDIAELPVNVEVKNLGDYTPKFDKSPLYAQVNTTNSMNTPEVTPVHSEVEDWGDYTPELLKTPLSAHAQNPESTLELLRKKKIEAINFQKKITTDVIFFR